MSEINTGGPAFPTKSYNVEREVMTLEEGMTLRQYAAIKLRVPNSGTEWLDEMIVQSLRDYFASKALQGLLKLTDPYEEAHWHLLASDAYKMADAMLKARNA